MTSYPFNMKNVHPSWEICLEQGLSAIDPNYLNELSRDTTWLPGADKIFNAFSLPLDQVNYVLFGESPYPRPESANGYAFWDAAVNELWSSTGLSKRVNRATSLRNLLKMLLLAEGIIKQNNLNQEAIAKLDKTNFIQTNDELFSNLLNQGFLLLNATPVLRPKLLKKDARAWLPFLKKLLECLHIHRPQVKFILLGRIAKTIESLIASPQDEIICGHHPYNLSFITSPQILNFFRPLRLLININKSILKKKINF